MKVNLRRVGDIAEQIRGVTYRKQDASTVMMDGFLPVLRAGNITDQGLKYDDLVYVPSSKISERQKVRKNDIIIAASSGSIDVVGKAARSTENFNGGFGAFCKVLRPRREVDPGYFAQYFKTTYYRRIVSHLAAGANINNLRNEDLNGLPIPLPPLSEQRRIAGILDAADALRAKRREALDQLDTLLQSTFLDMFGDPITNPMGWEVGKLGKWLEQIDSGWSPQCFEREIIGDEWGILKLGAVTWCEFNEKEHKALPHNLKPRPQIEVQKGDLLFTRKNTRQLVAAAAYVFSVRPRLMLPDLVFRLKLKGKAGLDPIFLWKLLIETHQRHNIQYLASGAAGSMPNISKSKLKSVELILPPLRLQQRFASIVESVERQKEHMRAHLAELDTLFASLQSRAFNGEL